MPYPLGTSMVWKGYLYLTSVYKLFLLCPNVLLSFFSAVKGMLSSAIHFQNIQDLLKNAMFMKQQINYGDNKRSVTITMSVSVCFCTGKLRWLHQSDGAGGYLRTILTRTNHNPVPPLHWAPCNRPMSSFRKENSNGGCISWKWEDLGLEMLHSQKQASWLNNKTSSVWLFSIRQVTWMNGVDLSCSHSVESVM